MGAFAITYASGDREHVVADEWRESGAWITFRVEGRDRLAVSADSVLRVESVEPPGVPPRQPGPPFRIACGLLLLATAAFCVVVGFADMFGAETVSGRILGAALIGAAVACAAGIHGIAVGGRAGSHRALIGALAATAVPVALLGLHVAGAGTGGLVAGALIGAATASGACALRWLAAGARPGVPTALRGLVAAGVLVGLVQFWYDREYVPAVQEGGLTQLVEMASDRSADDGDAPAFLTLTVTIRNVSETKVRSMGAHLTLWNVDPGRGQPLFVEDRDLDFPVGNWLTPGQEFVETWVIPVPDDPLPVMRAVLETHLADGDRIPHGQTVPCPSDDCPRAWKISETSLVSRLLRESRYIVQVREMATVPVRGDDEQVGQTRLFSCLSRSPDRCPDVRDVHLDELYGRLTVGSSTESVL